MNFKSYAQANIYGAGIRPRMQCFYRYPMLKYFFAFISLEKRGKVYPFFGVWIYKWTYFFEIWFSLCSRGEKGIGYWPFPLLARGRGVWYKLQYGTDTYSKEQARNIDPVHQTTECVRSDAVTAPKSMVTAVQRCSWRVYSEERTILGTSMHNVKLLLLRFNFFFSLLHCVGTFSSDQLTINI
jgi:hypothetical protein